jgi:hypothetical protein
MDNHAARTLVTRATNDWTTLAGMATPKTADDHAVGTDEPSLSVHQWAARVAGGEANVRGDERGALVRLSRTTP